jgi:hypothetical protein
MGIKGFDVEAEICKILLEELDKANIKENKLSSEIENLIIGWSIDGTKTAGHLTRKIMELLKDNK